MRQARWPALLSVLALIIGGCAGEVAPTGGDGGDGELAVIRFTFAPDPAWDWVKDQGILEEMEQESGFRIIQLATWDEFGTFAGGHADVVSTGSYETPLLDAQGVETLTFGQFNMNKDVMITGNPDWKTAADLPAGCIVASQSVVGNTIIWASLISQFDARELAEGSSDLGIAVADYPVIPTLIEGGDVCAGIVDPTQVIPAMASGDMFVMYDGKSASQLYGELVVPGHQGVNSNNFVSRKDWFDSHVPEAAFFLQVWDRAMQEWAAHREEIIDAYPQHFAVNSPEDAQFIKDYFTNTFDWFVESPYLTSEWVEGERGVYDLVRDAGLVDDSVGFPAHAIIDPATGEVVETIEG